MQLQHATKMHCIALSAVQSLFIDINLEHICNIFIIKSLYVLTLIMFVLSKNKGFQLVFNNVMAIPIARIRIKYKGRNVYVKIIFMALKVQPSKICKSRKSPNNVFYCSFILCFFLVSEQ